MCASIYLNAELSTTRYSHIGGYCLLFPLNIGSRAVWLLCFSFFSTQQALAPKPFSSFAGVCFRFAVGGLLFVEGRLATPLQEAGAVPLRSNHSQHQNSQVARGCQGTLTARRKKKKGLSWVFAVQRGTLRCYQTWLENLPDDDPSHWKLHSNRYSCRGFP